MAAPGLGSLVLVPRVPPPPGSPRQAAACRGDHLPCSLPLDPPFLWSVALIHPLSLSHFSQIHTLGSMDEGTGEAGKAARLCRRPSPPAKGPDGNPGPARLPGKNSTSGGETNRKGEGPGHHQCGEGGKPGWARLLVYNPRRKIDFPMPSPNQVAGDKRQGACPPLLTAPEETTN